VVELAVLCTTEKGVPFTRSELEYGAGGVLGIAYADPAIGQAGNLDAVAVGEAQGTLDPGQTLGTVPQPRNCHVRYLLNSWSRSLGRLQKVGYRLRTVCDVKTEDTVDL
jgi:hypothetical protein